MRIAAVLLLAAALPALASPIEYAITFTVGSDIAYNYLLQSTPGLGAPSGTFIYDSADTGEEFSDFTVTWGNASYDVTGYANAPMLATSPPTGCSSAVSGQPYGFALLDQNVTGCPVLGFLWSGSYIGSGYGPTGGDGYSTFFFILGAGTQGAQDEIGGSSLFTADPATYYEIAQGTWTINEVPEPGALPLLLLGALAVAGLKRARRAR